MTTSSSDYEKREQSKIKHFALQSYLEAAAPIIGSSQAFTYVDCCAGPWKSQSLDYSDTSFGVACRVLNKAQLDLVKRGLRPRFSAFLVERKKTSYKQLAIFAGATTSPHVSIRAENWDFSKHQSEIAAYCSERGSFPFMFIDPKGWKLTGMSKLDTLLRLKPGEVLINLMSSFVTRFARKNDLRDLLGEDYSELRDLQGMELECAIVQMYCDRVKEVGEYKYVCALPVMKSDTDAMHFYLIYATRHPKGVEVFKYVERKTEQQTHIVRAQVQQR